MCEAVLLAASLVVVIYLWSFLTAAPNTQTTEFISITSATFAAITIVAAGASYFVGTKTKKFLTESTLVGYLLLCTTVALVVLETGGANSPFVALWMFVSVLAGAFGRPILTLLFVLVNAYLAFILLSTQASKETLIAIILAGELPLILSFLLWTTRSKGESSKERAYYDLANELNQVSNKAEVVINAIAEGVIAVDTKGVIELINPAAQHIIGWGQQDAVGLGYQSVLHLVDKTGQELNTANDPIYDVMNTNITKSRNDLQLLTSSGKKLNVSVVVSPTGKLGSGVIIVFHDITKELQEERAQAEFISTASHEMRTPVASIEGYLGLALNPATATIDEKARDFINKAHSSAQHLGRLFQDLLDITKAEDGRLQNNKKVIDVVAYVKDIVEGFTPKATEKGLRLFFKPETKTSSLTGGEHILSPVFYSYIDADHLREVVGNLVENAIKYTPQGEVVIDIISDDSHTVISVTDSGIGIPAEDIPHLFQKFYRVDSTDTREIGGTGLGLYLCRRLAEAMNGRLWVESEYKKGSTFNLEIPRITHEEAMRLIERSEGLDQTESTLTPPNRRMADMNMNAKQQEHTPSAPAQLPPVQKITPPAPPAAAAVAPPSPTIPPTPSTPPTAKPEPSVAPVPTTTPILTPVSTTIPSPAAPIQPAASPRVTAPQQPVAPRPVQSPTAVPPRPVPAPPTTQLVTPAPAPPPVQAPSPPQVQTPTAPPPVPDLTPIPPPNPAVSVNQNK